MTPWCSSGSSSGSARCTTSSGGSASTSTSSCVNPLKFHYETLIFQTVIRKPYHYFVDKFTGKVASYTTSLSDELGMLLESVFFNYSGELVASSPSPGSC